MVDSEKLMALEKLCEPQEGDFENFKSEYQVSRINNLRDSLLEAIELLKTLSNLCEALDAITAKKNEEVFNK